MLKNPGHIIEISLVRLPKADLMLVILIILQVEIGRGRYDQIRLARVIC